MKKIPRTLVYLVRHGQQEEYGQSDSLLSDQGRSQILSLAEEIFADLKHAPGKFELHFRYSSRPRTKQSAEIIYNHLVKESAANPHIIIASFREKKLLQTADNLKRIIESGIPAAQAYTAWMSWSQAKLHQVGANTPSEVFKEYVSMLRSLETGTDSSKETSHRIYIMLTHETSLAAIARGLDSSFEGSIHFAEPIKISLAADATPLTFSFRGQVFKLA